MDVRMVSDSTVVAHPVAELQDLLVRGDGIVWVDIPDWNDEAARVLADVFGFHPLAVQACAERNRVPKVHAYRDHLFVVLHTPECGAGGHVHYVELDQFVGPRYLVTVHGPLNPALDPQVALRQTGAVLRRIEAGRLRPTSPFALSYAVLSAVARDMEAFVETRTQDVWRLEQQVTGGHVGDPEPFLEELFRARHGLLAVRTMAALSGEIYGRIAILERYVPAEARPLVDDVVDQFRRVCSLADGEKDYLQGVIDFYRTRTETKMTIAAERLAVIAVVTLPITALASVYGMNVIVSDGTDAGQLAVVLAVMVTMSGILLRWAKHLGWW